MERKINIACFKSGSRTAEVKDIWQWDYGQILRIQGLPLPTAVEIHFSLDEHGGKALRRIGMTNDGVTDVVIPDSMLKNESAYGDSYYFFAYIYLTDETSGNTEYKIRAKVSTRSKPEGFVSGGNDTFAEILKTVNEIAEDKVDIPVPAKVGQVLAVKATDESGKPTEFEATDPGGGVSDEKIAEAVGTYMEEHPFEESDPTVPQWAKKPEKPTYTASEVGALPAGTNIPSKTSELQNDSGFLTEHQDLSNYARKNEVPKTASDVGADADGTAESKVSEHNVSDTAHNDIRLLVQGLTDRLNALADSDDETLDQMSEIVSYIKYNRSLINVIDTNKVDVSDIVNNLISNNTDKPLSAKQGRALKSLIDAIIVPTKLSELENDSGYAKTTDIPDKLPNPQKLTFTGAVTAEYDGLGAVTVTIPESSGGSGVSDEKIAEAVGTYMETHPIEETDPTVPEWAKQQEKPSYTASEVGALPDTTKIPSKTSDLQNDSGFLTEHQDLSGYALKSEVPKSASDVGADAAGTAESKVSAHNTATDSHNDIRELISGLTQRLNALADSDDTTLDQMSEVVAYIKSNKSLIDAITTSKINVSDIIDNLTTNVSNKPLSAAQGVKLKALIDAITSVELDESLSDNTKAAPAGMVGELKGEIADKATLENGVVKFWKTSTEENRTDTLLYSVDISSIGGTGGLDLENLTLSVSQVGNYQRLSMSDGTTTKNVDIPITTITDEQVQTAVTEYLDVNPVQTGATQEEAEQIQKNTNDIAALKSDLNNKFTGGELDPNGNLIFETEIEIGVFLDEGNGSKLVNQYTTTYCVTPFIEIEPNISYSTGCLKDGISNGAYSTCFYDADNVFISGLKYKNLLTTPNNAKYIRLCWDGCNDMVGTGAFLLKKSTEIVTVYESPSYTPIRLVDSDYVTKEVTDNLDERVTVLEGSSNKRYINLASDYYITNGDTLELFYRGLLNLGDYKKYNIKIECSVGGYFEKRYIFTPTSSNVGNDYPFTLSLYDDNDKLIESATTTIHCVEKKSNPSNQVNVLCVGDSLTVGGQWITEFRRLLTADGLSNVNFIGTCGESPSKYEGYGGWSIASYNSSMATNDYMWVNVSSHDKTSADQHSVYVDSNGTKWKIETIETNRLKMIRTSGSSAIPTSGSLTWERGGDNHSDIVYSSVEQASGNPFWNENINKNDFVTYANQQGVSTIDYCLILIGWNNSHWNESITKAETNRFINSLQTDFPNCKIILAGLQIPSLDGFGNNYGCDWYWKEKVNFVFNLQKWYEDIASSNDNVIFTQVSGQFDSENNMPKYQRTVNKRNSDKEYFGANGVHPADSGYLQFADVFYRAFHAF